MKKAAVATDAKQYMLKTVRVLCWGNLNSTTCIQLHYGSRLKDYNVHDTSS
jgi:hypothetical protein